jgi:Restriction endonuclease NaeI
MLFRLAQRRIISRAVVATVAQQDDDMRRVRGNGGSRGRLRRVRGAQNGIFCRRRPGECPAKFSGPEPSRPVPGGSEWSAERRLTLPPVSPTLL